MADINQKNWPSWKVDGGVEKRARRPSPSKSSCRESGKSWGRNKEAGPSWLTWTNCRFSPTQRTGCPSGIRASEAEQLAVEELARRARPQVLARYDNGLPMLVRRQWGRGKSSF